MAPKKKSTRPAKRAAKKVAGKKTAAKRPARKKSSARKSSTKKSSSRKSSAKKSTSKKAKTSKGRIKKALPKPPSGVDAAKIVIPPVPSRGTTSISTTPAPNRAVAPASVPKKKNSSNVLFLVIAGVVLLAIFALTNSSSDSDDAAPKPTASESASEEPSAEPSTEPSESESNSTLTYEAPSGFVAINSGEGVTLRWKAPTATEGLTGYLISISYNAVDFKEVATVPADQLNLDVAKIGDEGGTQFFIQSVYSDGTKADGSKFALKGKYE